MHGKRLLQLVQLLYIGMFSTITRKHTSGMYLGQMTRWLRDASMNEMMKNKLIPFTPFIQAIDTSRHTHTQSKIGKS